MLTRRRYWHISLLILAICTFAVTALWPASGIAAEDRCIAVAERRSPLPVVPAQFRVSELNQGEVRISYVGHSTFLIESRKGVKVATDYNDYVRPSVLPDIITMNRAHTSHFTHFPDPKIKHVLPGWNPAGGVAQHDVTYEDVRVRNIPTNIRSWQGGTDEFGNSIFIFELGGLCIAHLGHLHHTLTDKQLAQIGQMDVVLVPVDGSYTLDLPGMVEVLKSLKAPLMLPMHYFSSFTLNRFLDQVRADYDVKMSETPTIVVSKRTLPQKPQVLVLPGY